jgi:dihydrophenazinedicarboxylate synthase
VDAEPIETLSGEIELDLPEFDDPPPDPLKLLGRWVERAWELGVREPQALALSTASPQGKPSVRTVLLKAVEPALVFAFPGHSRKARELEANPWAAGTLYWRETTQQVVVEGPVRQMSETESDELFAERPRIAQAATVASRQGEPLDEPAGLRAKAADLAAGDAELTRPSGWSGYELAPQRIEFWHGSSDRLHRRLLYVKSDEGWVHQRLQP